MGAPFQDDKDCLVIFFGANDAALIDGTSAKQHVPVKEYKENLCAMVDTVRNKCGGDIPIVLVSPPPVHEPSWAKFCKEDTSNRTFQQCYIYAKACEEAADEKAVAFVNLWKAFVEDQGHYEPQLNFIDGLHLSSTGNMIVGAHVLSSLPFDPEVLPLDAPLWDSIDPNNVTASFDVFDRYP